MNTIAKCDYLLEHRTVEHRTEQTDDDGWRVAAIHPNGVDAIEQRAHGCPCSGSRNGVGVIAQRGHGSTVETLTVEYAPHVGRVRDVR